MTTPKNFQGFVVGSEADNLKKNTKKLKTLGFQQTTPEDYINRQVAVANRKTDESLRKEKTIKRPLALGALGGVLAGGSVAADVIGRRAGALNPHKVPLIAATVAGTAGGALLGGIRRKSKIKKLEEKSEATKNQLNARFNSRAMRLKGEPIPYVKTASVVNKLFKKYTF